MPEHNHDDPRMQRLHDAIQLVDEARDKFKRAHWKEASEAHDELEAALDEMNRAAQELNLR